MLEEACRASDKLCSTEGASWRPTDQALLCKRARLPSRSDSDSSLVSSSVQLTSVSAATSCPRGRRAADWRQFGGTSSCKGNAITAGELGKQQAAAVASRAQLLSALDRLAVRAALAPIMSGMPSQERRELELARAFLASF
ncbi:4-hydroxyacetophenone monooxygenase isoform B [Chlorella sorokiniana]|uniref:4-hydroxyacetophenone monooxygenase isoform B n=1 Tax=Chlorella sorokiniana TaxID=3076 RepID=A0A2P6TD31_CHLSO|nr:4-hydroxyacetophenone monooxygenase isoform B [Chlorella sorokiniana]|eukprot:PRW20548.1 4-hydroxyacetophenone monooxygenase isoform B [Chlorella sorokiniana]